MGVGAMIAKPRRRQETSNLFRGLGFVPLPSVYRR
jgi:hypothetical protein